MMLRFGMITALDEGVEKRMRRETRRKRKKSTKRLIIALSLVLVGAVTTAAAYFKGYSEYLAAEREQKQLQEELRLARAEQDMPLLSEEDYDTEFPIKTPGDRREEIIQAKPPNMIESQSGDVQEKELESDPDRRVSEETAALSELESQSDNPADIGGGFSPETGGHETTTTSPHQIGLYTGIDLTAAKAKNSDFIAWLMIPGTKVDYPVVLTDNMDYYLTHGFTGKTSKLGTLFSLGKTDYKTPGINIAIYGHHITDTSSGQKMFRPLLSYKQKNFWENHQMIYLDSLYHCGKYRIFAVINMVNDEWDPSTATFADADELMDFIRLAQSCALYETGVEVTMTDWIITLITCDRSFAAKEGRLVVMAVEQ